jgi:uncharacterized RDD family membrane protein YckC
VRTVADVEVGNLIDMNSRPPLATVLKRFAAILIDGILFSLVAIPLYIGAYLIATSMVAGGDILVTIGTFLVLLGYVAINAYAAFVLAMWAYGLTPGKKLLGMQVVRVDNGAPASFWRMALRQIIGQWLSAIVCYLGFIWALFDANRQGWHDKLAKTLVVQTR